MAEYRTAKRHARFTQPETALLEEHRACFRPCHRNYEICGLCDMDAVSQRLQPGLLPAYNIAPGKAIAPTLLLLRTLYDIYISITKLITTRWRGNLLRPTVKDIFPVRDFRRTSLKKSQRCVRKRIAPTTGRSSCCSGALRGSLGRRMGGNWGRRMYTISDSRTMATASLALEADSWETCQSSAGIREVRRVAMAGVMICY